MLSSYFPSLRGALRAYGLRTRQEWFPGFISTVRLPNGKTLRLSGVDSNYLSFELHWKDWTYYEPLSILLLRELLRESATFYDIGANVGYYSLVAASEKPGLDIVAFEPNPKVYGLLANNATLNAAAIQCEPLALSDTEGEGLFVMPSSDMSGTLEAGFHVLQREKHLDHRTVRVTTLDRFVADHPPRKPMLLKVDVEGHERAFIGGALAVLREHKPDIIMEVSFDHAPETEALLHDMGYTFYQIRDDGMRPAKHLTFCKEGSFLFLNYLLTTKSPEAVQDIFERNRAQISSLDLRASSLYRGAPSADSSTPASS